MSSKLDEIVKELRDMAYNVAVTPYIVGSLFSRVKDRLPEHRMISGSAKSNVYLIPLILHRRYHSSIALIEVYGDNTLEYSIDGKYVDITLKPSKLHFKTYTVLLYSFNTWIDVPEYYGLSRVDVVKVLCKIVDQLPFNESMLAKVNNMIASKIGYRYTMSSSIKIIARGEYVNMVEDTIYYSPLRGIYVGERNLTDAYIKLCVNNHIATLFSNVVSNIYSLYYG